MAASRNKIAELPSICQRAENETRTRDPNLGKVVLYQLSYFRKKSDSYRIQTYNLLIRSQMLYSVELRSHSIVFPVDADGFEPPTLCL